MPTFDPNHIIGSITPLYPRLPQVAKIMVPHLRFYFHELVRAAAAEILPYLLECIKPKGTISASVRLMCIIGMSLNESDIASKSYYFNSFVKFLPFLPNLYPRTCRHNICWINCISSSMRSHVIQSIVWVGGHVTVLATPLEQVGQFEYSINSKQNALCGGCGLSHMTSCWYPHRPPGSSGAMELHGGQATRSNQPGTRFRHRGNNDGCSV